MNKRVATIEKEWQTASGLQAVVVKHMWLDSFAGRLPSVMNSNWLCGYVGVPKTHSLYGFDYDQLDAVIKVHGGLTYSDYKPVEAITKDLWYFGFDCNHYNDSPEVQDLAYVVAECERLAAQLKEDT